ncbi:MAG TPA: hypothetical protein PLL20_19390 [Phycisphaerae bacterium]|nr:hypothetical protein [Phycisphaerae bacterium]
MRVRQTSVDGLIDRHGNCRSLGAQWNHSPILYTPAPPADKTAALEAAIEFEDRSEDTSEMMYQTCERCRWWKAILVGFGRVAPVCHCHDAVAHYMIQTGAATTCEQWTPSLRHPKTSEQSEPRSGGERAPLTAG